MRKLFCAFCLMALLASCSKKWEYKTVRINGQSYGTFSSPDFSDPSSTLNELGKEGWEVVGTYTEVNTVFPNFGEDKYVTGIRSNTATTVVNFVLKRELGMTSRNKENE